jgi:hypothetical protein
MELILQIEQSIRSSPEWLKAEADKAKVKKISLDSMLRLDAIYIYKTKYQNKK